MADMTPPQRANSPKFYYSYSYSGTPTENAVGLFPMPTSGPSSAVGSPSNAPGSLPPSTPTSRTSLPHLAPMSSASGDTASPPAYAYSQYALAANSPPATLSQLNSPMGSPHYYYARFTPLIPQHPTDSTPSSIYAVPQASHSPSVVSSGPPPPAVAPAVGAGAVSSSPATSMPFYSRQSRRLRRKSDEDVPYTMNFPSHPVPDQMYVPMGPPDASWRVMPPKPDDIHVRRYATGVDERNFFTVLEYKINEQPIIWDYYTGYVHLTGIWKAIGHAKADIGKLLDNSPELEPIIKRVRGGFLKIQGTWVPFDVAHRLAKHICYYIRFALVPVFGPGFPEECTRPDEAGFGQLHLNQPFASLAQANGKNAVLGVQAGNAPQPSPTQAPRHPARQHATQAPTHLQHQPQHVHKHEQLQQSALQHHTPVVNQSSLPQKLATHSQGPMLGSGRHPHHRSSDDHAGREVAREALKDGRRRRESGGRPRAMTASSHHRSDSFNSIRRAIEQQRVKVESGVDIGLPGLQSLVLDLADEETYDENVFEDEEAVGSISPPPMPRKLSFRDEQRVSECPSELIEMLKATRSLQQMSAGRRPSEHWGRTGGGFECAGRQFHWDGSDRLDVVLDAPQLSSTKLPQLAVPKSASPNEMVKERELTPPPQVEQRLPSLSKILNFT